MAVAARGASAADTSESRYRKLQPRWCGLTKQQVAADQRRRLFEAMVDVAATRGYPAATIKAVSTTAGVSRQTFYDLFGGGSRHPRDACFLGAYDYVVARAAERIKASYRNQPDPDQRLRCAFEQFAREAAGEPHAACFVLVETLGAGPAALARMERGRRAFEQMIAASIGDRSDGVFSPTIAKGIVGGVERIARMHLIAGEVDRLAATADQLSLWVSSYRPWRSRSMPADAAAGEAMVGSIWRPPQLADADERIRVMRAAAAIAARAGYPALTPAKIAKAAGVSADTFASFYGGQNPVEECFLASLDLLGAEALARAARASERAEGWAEALGGGVRALLEQVAHHPFLGRVAFIEIFSVGPSAIERRSALLRRFADALIRRAPASQQPSQLVAEAIVGGIWTIIHHHVACGQAQRLPAVADDAVYLVLAPLVGHAAAILPAQSRRSD